MRRAAVLAGCALATGCTFGAGSARVGQWVARREPAIEACLASNLAAVQTPTTVGGLRAPCAERKQVVRERPARRFWGVITQAPTIGYASARLGEERFRAFRFAASLEFLRGRGRWAYGLRGGLLADRSTATDGRGFLGYDALAMGHLAVTERLSLYAGLGYLPYAKVDEQTTSLGGRGLLGLQLPLNKTHSDNSIVLTLELDHVRLADLPSSYRSFGGVATLGIFF